MSIGKELNRLASQWKEDAVKIDEEKSERESIKITQAVIDECKKLAFKGIFEYTNELKFGEKINNKIIKKLKNHDLIVDLLKGGESSIIRINWENPNDSK